MAKPASSILSTSQAPVTVTLDPASSPQLLNTNLLAYVLIKCWKIHSRGPGGVGAFVLGEGFRSISCSFFWMPSCTFHGCE